MKIATVAVVLPSMCSAVERNIGIFKPTRFMNNPSKVDNIRGFFENLFDKVFIFEPFSPSSLYNSNTAVAVITLTKLIVDADRAASLSASAEPNANIIKGIPKKAKLPNTVTTIRRYNVCLSFIILNKNINAKKARVIIMGIIPAKTYVRVSLEKFTS